jgi:hypothetical protein
MEAVGRGFGQGLTFNTLDEMMGGVRGALRAWESGDDLKKAISEETEIARRGFRKSERERPIATGVGQVAGAVLPTALAPASAIPRTVLGRVGAGAAGGALAGAGKAEQGVGTEEFKHHVKTGALTGGVAQGGFNLGKLVIGKTGKATAGVLGAISQSVPKAIKGAALAAVPGPLKAGFNKTIKLMENGDLPPEQSGRLMRGLRSGGAGLASAYIDLINEDVEFARQVQGEKKGLSSIIPDRKKNDLEERIRSDLFNHPIPKSLEKSTASGRAQSFMDSLIGADKIGLDPGEKPKGGQPSTFDEDLVAILPLFGGITKKITKLDLAKRKELLEKKGKNLSGIDAERLRILEKAEMSPERKQKLIDGINEGIEGKSGSRVSDLDRTRNQLEKAAYYDLNKNYNRITDMMPAKLYLGKYTKELEKLSPGNPTGVNMVDRLKIIARISGGTLKKAANNALRRHDYLKNNQKEAKFLRDVDYQADLLSGDKRDALFAKKRDIEDKILEWEMPDTKEIGSAKAKLKELMEGMPSLAEIDKLSDESISKWKLGDLKKKKKALMAEFINADPESISKWKLGDLKKKKKALMAEFGDISKRNKILDDLYRGDKYKEPNPAVGFPFKGLEGGTKGIKNQKLRALQRELDNLNDANLNDDDFVELTKIPKATTKQLQKMKKEYTDKLKKFSHRNDWKFINKVIDYWLLKKGK